MGAAWWDMPPTGWRKKRKRCTAPLAPKPQQAPLPVGQHISQDNQVQRQRGGLQPEAVGHQGQYCQPCNSEGPAGVRGGGGAPYRAFISGTAAGVDPQGRGEGVSMQVLSSTI